MKPEPSPPRTFAAPLAYWLLLLAGLSALTWVRLDDLGKMTPLWLGAVVGTGFGQILGWKRMRLWLVGVIILNSMWFGALMMMPFWGMLKGLGDPWTSVEVSVLAFAPAALGGYFALGERGALVAFWFPAVLWMLAILDRPGGTTLADRGSWLLLSALAALFLGFVHARETRRLALWRRHATVRISPPRSRAVLREAPLRVVAQVGWLAGLGAATLLLTAWIAPHLWHKEKIETRATMRPPGDLASGTGGAASAICCPETDVVTEKRERVREYFPLLHTQDGELTPPGSGKCVVCSAGVPTGTGSGAASSPGGADRGTGTGKGDPVASTGGSGTAYPDATASAPAAEASPVAPTPTAAPLVPSPAPTTAQPARAATPLPPPHRAPVAATTPRSTAARPRPVVITVVGSDEHPIEWLLTLALVGLALHLALRPLRRLLTLRHLGRPFWPETVDQRVSNLWELMLIGLRDAGFRTIPGEQPQDLARRVGLDGMQTCAAVLERARHGVRVDAADLAAMRAAAQAVYGAARGGVGRAARAAAWLRWPLV